MNGATEVLYCVPVLVLWLGPAIFALTYIAFESRTKRRKVVAR